MTDIVVVDGTPQISIVTVGEQGPPGPTLPGGTTGQVVRKATDAPYEIEWHSLVKADVGLSNADNTSDANKPVSIAQALADAAVLSASAPAAKGVTNGDSHDHSGGDGAQIAHGSLSSIGTNTHAQIDSHLGSTSNPHSVTKAQVGLTNAEDKTFAVGVADATHAATNKTTPVDADEFGIADSAASFVLKKLSWANLKATMAAYYNTLSATLTNKTLTDARGTLSSDIRLTAVSASLPNLTFVDSCFHLAKDDTDKGAWRKRKGQSWRSEVRSAGKYLGTYSTATTAVAAGGALTDVYYNTTNLRFEEITNVGTPASTVTYRAGREDYPTNALITAEAARVIIWDLDLAVPSMWMVFIGGNFSYALGTISTVGSVAAINGNIGVGDTSYDVKVVDMVSDRVIRYGTSNISGYFAGNISQRNMVISYFAGALPAIISRAINDVAITVLPDAPLDEYGMPVPTIAVATAGGVSEIQNDGTVKNSLSTTASYGISYDELNRIRWNTTTEYNCSPIAPRAASFTASSATEPKLSYAAYSTSNVPISPAIATATGKSVKGAIASTNGLTIYKAGQSANALHAAITSTYNTGYMVGDIRRAWLADNLSGTIVDTELVTNGTFDTDTTGWTPGNGATLSVVANALQVTNDATGTNAGYAYGTFAAVIGRTYNLSVLGTNGTGANNPRILIGGAINNGAALTLQVPGYASVLTGSFIANASTMYVTVNTNITTASAFATFDNISVKEVSADRCVKNKPLSIVGTLTRTAYTGGRTVYSGFSAANYFQEASNADWNALSTGDFSIIMSGVKWGTAGTARCIISMGNGTSEGSVFLQHHTTNVLVLYIWNSVPSAVAICTSTATFTDTAEHTVEFKRYTQSGVASTVAIVVDGVVVASAVSTLTISNTTGYMRIGEAQHASQPRAGGFCACVRISATAPTAEQSKYIAAQENALNGGNACLLSNSSSVSALSYDKDTNSLFVGNGTNVDTFNGLKRIASQAHGVTTLTSVTSINGRKLIAGTGASYTAPERNISAELLEGQTKPPRTQNYSFTSAAVTKALPAGWKAQGVLFNLTDGTMSSASQTFDGFLWTLASLTSAKAYQIQLVEA